MQTLLTELTISMSDFKKNPAKVLREAGTQPVAVMSHNKVAFYMVEPQLFQAIMEEIADAQIIPLLKERLAQRANAIGVDVEVIKPKLEDIGLLKNLLRKPAKPVKVKKMKEAVRARGAGK